MVTIDLCVGNPQPDVGADTTDAIDQGACPHGGHCRCDTALDAYLAALRGDDPPAWPT